MNQDIERIFDEDGKQLLRLNEIDFVHRTPEVKYICIFMRGIWVRVAFHKANDDYFWLFRINQAGSTLFAQLEIWKASRCCSSDTLRQTQSASTNQSGDLSPWNVSECNDATGTGEFSLL